MDVFEDLCYAYTTGKFKRNKADMDKLEAPAVNTRSLKKTEKMLIRNSLPRAAADAYNYCS